jgi:hypothetical protein
MPWLSRRAPSAGAALACVDGEANCRPFAPAGIVMCGRSFGVGACRIRWRGEQFAEDVARFLAEHRRAWQRRMRRQRHVHMGQVRPLIEVTGGVDGAVVAEMQK